MTVETVVTNNGSKSKNGKFKYEEGKGEMPLFGLGEDSGFYFKPKSVQVGNMLDPEKVQKALVNDNTKLPKRPYTIDISKAGGQGRGLVIRKKYQQGKPKYFGLINAWDETVTLDESYIERIIELAKQSVTRIMSDFDLANDA